MTCESARDRLDDYVAGRLDPAAAEHLRDHLRTCTGCRLDEAAARFLAPKVAALPRGVDPTRPLWDDIDRRIRRRARVGVRHWLPLAAALALIVGAGSWAALLFSRGGARAPSAAVAAPETPAMERAYRIASDELETAVVDQAGLIPAAASPVARDVRTMNAAIDEARQALAAEPGNELARELYRAALRRKLDLLRRSAALYGVEG